MVKDYPATIYIEIRPSLKTIRETISSFTKNGLINIDKEAIKDLSSDKQIRVVSLTTPKAIYPSDLEELAGVLSFNAGKPRTAIKKIVLDIAGDPSLTLFEVNKIIDLISKNMPESTEIIFGAHVLPKLKSGRKMVCILRRI